MIRPFYQRIHDDDYIDEVTVSYADGSPLLKIATRYRFKTSGLSGNQWRTCAPYKIYNDDGPVLHEDTYTNVRFAALDAARVMARDGKLRLSDARVTFKLLRKGFVCLDAAKPTSIVEAFVSLPWYLGTVNETPEWKIMPEELGRTLCFQPGCAEKKVSEYRVKVCKCKMCGHAEPPSFAEIRRCFCERHLDRGDQGGDDSNGNYEVVIGPGPRDAKGFEGDVSESTFGGIIEL